MKRILLVDDDEEMCLEMEEILKAENFDVRAVHNGAQGCELMKSNFYDLAILDLKLPGLNGYEVLKNARKAKPELKIIILSGRPLGDPLLKESGSYDIEEENTLKLANAVLNKPFIVEDFLAVVNELAHGQ